MKPHTFFRDGSLMVGLPSIFFRQRARSQQPQAKKKKVTASTNKGALFIISHDNNDYDADYPLLVLASEEQHCSVIVDLQHFLESYMTGAANYYQICRPWCTYWVEPRGAYVMAGGDQPQALSKHRFNEEIVRFPEICHMRNELKNAGDFRNANVFITEAETPMQQPLTLSFALFELAVSHLIDKAKVKCPSALDFFMYLQEVAKLQDEDPEVVASKGIGRAWRLVRQTFLAAPPELGLAEGDFWRGELLPRIRQIMRQEY